MSFWILVELRFEMYNSKPSVFTLEEGRYFWIQLNQIFVVYFLQRVLGDWFVP